MHADATRCEHEATSQFFGQCTCKMAGVLAVHAAEQFGLRIVNRSTPSFNFAIFAYNVLEYI